jgi:D-alanyl-D-alanine carboxypeptidase (penicillin-binding protein 5/6)
MKLRHSPHGVEMMLDRRIRWQRANRFTATCLLVFLTLLPLSSAAAQAVPELKVNSKRYIVVDADTGQVYAQKGASDQVAIASLTKVFTAILAIETAPLETEITTQEADVFGSSSTTMGFGAGETFTLEELLYGMMLPSGNDAAHAIARHLGQQPGDSADEAVNRFMKRLNQRVQDMGLRNTKLVNPHGWGVPGHYSSAGDLAAFMMFALQYPTFVDTMSATTYSTRDGSYYLTNTNKLLRTYDGLVGGKTGYDDDSGWCLIEVARRDGSTMISVTLDGIAPDDWYDDNRVLLDYAFEQKAATDGQSPPSGDRVSFLDPDAAVISRSSDSGAAFYAPMAVDSASAGASERAALQPEGQSFSTDPAFDGDPFWIAASATLAILGLRGSGVYFERRRDSRRLDKTVDAQEQTSLS